MDSIAYVGSKALGPCSRRLTRIPFHARVLSVSYLLAWIIPPGFIFAFRDCHRGHRDGENRSMAFLECLQVPFFYRDVPVRSRLPW